MQYPYEKLGVVKEEFAATPQPREGLNDAGPPPFLTKTYEIVEDLGTNDVVSWSRGNNSFVVWDPQKFSMGLLPKYFKHNNFSSFVRQLNTYGFKKVDPDRWEFANEGFLRGQKHLLRNIRRRKSSNPNQSSSSSSASQQDLACVELGWFGLDGEIERLKRDKQVLITELVKLRQQQQGTKSHLRSMEGRLRKTELKQQQMMNFLARAMQNPSFVQQLVQHKEKRRELEDAIRKKRRRPIEPAARAGPDLDVEIVDCHDHHDMFVKMEPQDHGTINDLSEFDEMLTISEEEMKIDMVQEDQSQSYREIDHENKVDFDDGFWKNLLNESMEDNEIGINVGVNREQEDEDDEDVDNILVELGNYLACSPK